MTGRIIVFTNASRLAQIPSETDCSAISGFAVEPVLMKTRKPVAETMTRSKSPSPLTSAAKGHVLAPKDTLDPAFPAKVDVKSSS